MKIIDTFVLVLIAGILSFSNAAERNVEELCSRNGGPKAYADLMNSANEAKTCLESVKKEVTSEYSARSNSVAGDYIALVCNKVEDNSIKNCIKSVVGSAKICEDKNGQETLDTLFKMTLSMLRFGCENTELLTKVFTSSDRQCFTSKQEPCLRCFDQDFVTQGPNSLRPNLMESPTNISDLLSSIDISFSSQECNELLIAEQCAVNVLQQCQDKVFSEILDKLFKDVNNDLQKCKDLPRSPRTSDASPTSVVDAMILIISVITISWYN